MRIGVGPPEMTCRGMRTALVLMVMVPMCRSLNKPGICNSEESEV